MGGLVALATGMVLSATLAIAARRHADFDAARAAALDALTAARQAEAERWASTALAEAEAALRAADSLHKAEDARFVTLPDFSRANDQLQHARDAAARAVTTATFEKEDARLAADEAIQLTSHAVAQVTAFSSAMELGTRRRTAASRSEMLLHEAQILYRDRQYSLARERAVQAQKLAHDVTGQATAIAARYADQHLVRRWREWADETVRWSQRTGEAAIIVSKADHHLTLYVAGRPVRSYAADLSYNWVVDKAHAGDGATPEGRYRIVEKKDRGASTFHKALLLDYPNAADRAAYQRARRRGVIPAAASIGGLIEIHGEGGRGEDWTRGCVALPNREMDEVFSHVRVGTPVTIIGTYTPRDVDNLVPIPSGGRGDTQP